MTKSATSFEIGESRLGSALGRTAPSDYNSREIRTIYCYRNLIMKLEPKLKVTLIQLGYNRFFLLTFS